MKKLLIGLFLVILSTKIVLFASCKSDGKEIYDYYVVYGGHINDSLVENGIYTSIDPYSIIAENKTKCISLATLTYYVWDAVKLNNVPHIRKTCVLFWKQHDWGNTIKIKKCIA